MATITHNCTIVNLTVYNGAAGGINPFSAAATGDTSNVTVNIYNTVSMDNNGGPDFQSSTGGTGGTENVSLTNYNCASSDGTADDYGGSGNLVSQSASSFFNNAGSDDFTLKAGSNGILAGLNELPDVYRDVVAKRRQPSGNFDIGAFRYPFPQLSNGMIQFFDQ